MASVLEPIHTPEPVTPRSNTQEDQEGHHHPSADPSYYSPTPALTAFPSVGASPEAGWEDDIPAAKSEDEAEWEDDAAAESEDEADWEDDVPAAEPEGNAGGEADTGEPDSPPRWWPSNSARRDPRKAEPFRRLDAACEARRLEEARRRKPPPLPTGAGDTDEPIWPPTSPHWMRFRELRATKCSPVNPVLNPDENSVSRPPSNKSKEVLSDKVVDQRDDTKQYSKNASATKCSPANPVLNPDENSLSRPPSNTSMEVLSDKVVDQRDDTKQSSKSASATKCSPANPVLNPDENSLSRPPSNKSKEVLSDKVVDQWDGTKQSSNSASSHIVLYEKGHGENPLPVPSKRIKHSIDTYAVQCGKCLKWRLVPDRIKYEEIRRNSIQVRFSCEHVHGWKPGVSCDDPADISQDDGFWVIDKQCVSQAPLGWERTISIRSEGCGKFADVYCRPPKGKQLRSLKQVELYLQANPDHAAGIQPCKDWFKVPEPLHVHVKKRRRQSEPLEPNEVLPLSCAPPIHEDLSPKCVLALYDADQY